MTSSVQRKVERTQRARFSRCRHLSLTYGTPVSGGSAVVVKETRSFVFGGMLLASSLCEAAAATATAHRQVGSVQPRQRSRPGRTSGVEDEDEGEGRELSIDDLERTQHPRSAMQCSGATRDKPSERQNLDGAMVNDFLDCGSLGYKMCAKRNCLVCRQLIGVGFIL